MDVHRVCAKTAKIDFWAKELKTIDFRWMTLFRAPWASRYTFSIIACRTWYATPLDAQDVRERERRQKGDQKEDFEALGRSTCKHMGRDHCHHAIPLSMALMHLHKLMRCPLRHVMNLYMFTRTHTQIFIYIYTHLNIRILITCVECHWCGHDGHLVSVEMNCRIAYISWIVFIFPKTHPRKSSPSETKDVEVGSMLVWNSQPWIFRGLDFKHCWSIPSCRKQCIQGQKTLVIPGEIFSANYLCKVSSWKLLNVWFWKFCLCQTLLVKMREIVLLKLTLLILPGDKTFLLQLVSTVES